MTQEDVAISIGINRNTYISYESGSRRLPLEVAETICSALGVRPEFLLTGQGPIFVEHFKPDEFVCIKQYGVRDQASQVKGTGGEETVERMALRRDWLQSLGLGDGDSVGIIEIKGDNMEPVLKNGDWVLLDTSARRITGAGIYCIQLASELTCRTCAKDQDGAVHVMSYNQIYKNLRGFNFTYNDADPNAPRVIGRAVLFIRTLW